MLRRREAVLGGLALGLAALSGTARASAGSRQLRLYRDGSEIGGKTVAVSRDGGQVTVQTRIEIDVRFLGIPAYRYRLQADEIWQDGVLQSLEAETDDNGTAYAARAAFRDGAVMVEGTEYSGPAPLDAATTSYWSPAFLTRGVWISTQDGRLLNVQAVDRGVEDFPVGEGSVAATRWEITGDLQDLMLFYDASGEWIGTEFPARGETARFAAVSRGPALTPLWVDA